MKTNLPTARDSDDSATAPDFSGVLPTLIDSHRSRSYQVGYARGRSDAHLALLESTQEFRRLHQGSTAEVRRLIQAFSDLVEQRIQGNAPGFDGFIGGLGI